LPHSFRHVLHGPDPVRLTIRRYPVIKRENDHRDKNPDYCREQQVSICRHYAVLWLTNKLFF
jgi:hypothetical protein